MTADGARNKAGLVQSETSSHWLPAVRTSSGVIAIFGRIAQLPFQTIWRDGTRGQVLPALMYGTVGDLFTAATSLLAGTRGAWR